MNQLKSPSYMELRIDLDGKEPLFLRIPTFWDSIESRWIGAIKTPKTLKLIKGEGKTSFDLQNSFNIALHAMFQSEYAEEVFSMFKPKSHWDWNMIDSAEDLER